MHAFLAADGKVTQAAPAAGSLAFPAATPPGAPAPLRFAFAAPVRFVPGGGFEVTLALRADKPLVARDTDGNAFELTIEPGGSPVRVALADAVLAPGATASVSATVQAPGAEYAKGDAVTLVVQPLMPALAEGALFVLVGPAASTMNVAAMRVPTPKDLEMQDTDLTTFLLESENFTPSSSDAFVNTFLVAHGAVTPPAAAAWSANGTYVVLRGEEEVAEASAHAFPDRERRIAAAHAFTVNGVLARVHPGLGVVVPVERAPVDVRCVANCPAGGFAFSIAANGSASSADRPSSLVPPPRDTRGIPVSGDAPEEKGTPGSDPAVVIAFVALAAIAWRRR